MDAVAAFILGMLAGLVIYWLIYRIYWRRWRKDLERDMSYLREKVKSAEGTNFGLERQLTTQKAELAGLRSKFSDLERVNRQAQARIEEMNAEEQGLTMHLDALRAELATYKKMMAEPGLPALTLPQHLPQHPNGKTHHRVLAVDIPQEMVISAPLNGNGSGALRTEALKKKPSNGSVKTDPLPGEFIEPEIIFARPRIGGDRLEIIPGIRPAVAKKLYQAGIDSFQALSVLTAERLKEVVGPRTANLIDAEGILCQAKKLAGDRKKGR